MMMFGCQFRCGHLTVVSVAGVLHSRQKNAVKGQEARTFKGRINRIGSGVSGPDPDPNISPTSLPGPKKNSGPCSDLLAGRSLVLKFWDHTTTSECGRCLVLLHRDSEGKSHD